MSVKIWTLTDGKIGMQAQAEGLAQQFALLSGGLIRNVVVHPTWLEKTLPPPMAAMVGCHRFTAADGFLPAIAIGCGSQVQAALLAVKKRYRAFSVCIQRPSMAASHYDAIVAPRHDYAAAELSSLPANTISTIGAVGKVTPESLVAARAGARRRFAAHPPPYVAALIGGDNRAYRLNGEWLIQQLSRIIAASGATLLITPSRRTDSTLMHQLYKHFGSHHYLWDGKSSNPYRDILAAADGYCITADSANMISEACASGRTVYVLPLSTGNGWRARRAAQKFITFHNTLRARGNIRFFEDGWEFFTATPLTETQQAAKQLWQRYRQAASGGE